MKVRHPSALAGLVGLALAGCALSPKSASPWRAAPSTAESTEVSFRMGNKQLTLYKASPYGAYRILSRSEFGTHHVPIGAASAFAGRQGRYNYDVFYLVEENGEQAIYNFTFGKFDIDWPPSLLYRIDRSGRAQAVKILP